jgi:(2S)-methylsuccinyl-CoA dehydrogenase
LSDLIRSVGSLEVLLNNLRAQVVARIPDGNPDTDQNAVNTLVWASARAHAAIATAEWAGRTADARADQIAAAAVESAHAFISGESALDAIERSQRLARVAAAYSPVDDLGATHEQRMLRATFRGFSRREIEPVADAIHRQDLDIPESIIKGLSQLGVFGLSIPSEYGGSHSASEDFESMLIVTEELSRASLACGSLATRPEILVRALLRAGTEEQKQRFLRQIASGEKLVSVATTEPDFGSDIANIRCRAEMVDGRWIVNGSKLWCTFAGRAELMMLLARTSGARHRGLSVFLLEKEAFPGHVFSDSQPTGGVLRGRAIPTIGYRGMHTYELSFDNYGIPADSLLGGDAWLNRGFYLQMEGFGMGRLQTAARAVGVMRAALDATLAYASARQVFGRSVADFELVQAMLGQMIVSYESARQMSYRAARSLTGRPSSGGQVEAALAKLYASRLAEEVARDAVQLHGGMGYAEETSVSRYYVDAKVLPIFEGAEEMLAMRVIGKAALADAAD